MTDESSSGKSEEPARGDQEEEEREILDWDASISLPPRCPARWMTFRLARGLRREPRVGGSPEE